MFALLKGIVSITSLRPCTQAKTLLALCEHVFKMCCSLSPCYAEHDSHPCSTHCLPGNDELMVWTCLKLQLFKEGNEWTGAASLEERSVKSRNELSLSLDLRSKTLTLQLSPKYRKSAARVSSRAVQVRCGQLWVQGERENIPRGDCFKTVWFSQWS